MVGLVTEGMTLASIRRILELEREVARLTGELEAALRRLSELGG